MQNSTARYPTFEANKIQRIQELSPVSSWHHLPSELNPADLASRGLDMSEPVQVDRWIHCDKFLWGPKEEWSKEPEGLGQLPDGIFDLNSQTTSSFTHSLERQTSGEIVNSIFARVGSWRKLTRVVAWWVRLKVILLRSSLLTNL